MRSLLALSTAAAAALASALMSPTADAFSVSMSISSPDSVSAGRRVFLSKATMSASAAVTAAAMATSFGAPTPSLAATPQIFQTASGVKYATLQKAQSNTSPQPGDIVAIEYTGYLVDGTIFDATHAQGKQNALLFQVGSTAVIPGLNDMVLEMKVGQKVQAIIPPKLAFGDKGICIEVGEEGSGKQECLVNPGSTLVYDVYLKKSSIPPP